MASKSKRVKVASTSGQAGSLPSPACKGVATAFPLSPAQMRMWRADREGRGNPAFNLAFRWRLEGALDGHTLERAFNEILCRHEVLRARIAEIGSEPVQIIEPIATINVTTVDLRSLQDELAEKELDRLCGEEARRGFDLEEGPLLRAGLIRLRDSEHVLTLTVHHIVADGWSIGVIMRDVQRIYAAFAEHRDYPLEKLALQYADYVVWQSEQASGGEAARQLDYWRKKVAGSARLEIDADFPRPAERSVNGAIVSRVIPQTLSDAVIALANREGATFFVATLAVWQALLHRYSGAADISVGSALAGRDRTELEGLVGPFMNQILLRTDASGDPTFAEFIARARDTVWEAVANQDVPFELVTGGIRDDGKPWSDPLVLVNFNCHRAYGGGLAPPAEFCGIQITPIPSKSQGTLYDLNLFMIERDGQWRASLEFNTDLYRESRAEQILKDFCGMLEKVTADPQRRLSQYSVPEAKKSLPERPAAEPGADASVAADAPEAALAAIDDVYVLPASVAQKRFWLLTKVSPDTSAFHMLATVRLSGRLSVGALERSFATLVDRHEILRTSFKELDGALVQVVAPKIEFSLPLTDVSNLAAAQSDAELVELLRKEAGKPFDLAVGPLFRAHLFRVSAESSVLTIILHHIVSDGWSQSVLQNELWTVYEALAAEQLPQLPELSIQYGDFAAWQNDWLKSDEARQHLEFWTRRLSPPLPVLNLPTDRAPNARSVARGAIESRPMPDALMQSLKALSQSHDATIFMLMVAAFGVLLSRCSNQDDVLIGSPVANRRPETEPLIGPFAGPFALRMDLSGGPTLVDALERVRDVTLDAFSHTDLPFETLFDRLKVRSAGGRNPLFQFYFLYQRAFLQARQLPGLTVTPMPAFSVGTPFEMQLSVIERPEGVRVNLEYNADLFDAQTIGELLAYYEGILEAFASTPDVRLAELAPPARAASGRTREKEKGEQDYVAPRDPIEVRLTQIWEKLFELPRIGMHDNFFDLGGHSLLAAQLFAAVETEFGVTINLSALLVAPTIELLAKRLQTQTEASHLIPLKTSGRKLPLFCIHSAGGHVLRYRDMAAVVDDDQPLYGLSAPNLDGAHDETTVEELATRYIADIRELQPRGPYRLCGLSFGGLVAYEIAVQLSQMGEVVDVLALFDTGNPAYYRRLPPSRSVKFRMTYLMDRFAKYGRNLAAGRIDEIVSDGRQFVGSRVDALVWKVVRVTCRALGRPVPKPMRDNVIMFTAIGRAYTPKPFPGRLLLFRARGRTAEYGDDATLGWHDVALDAIQIHHVSGDHMTIMRQPFVADLVAQLTPYLT